MRVLFLDCFSGISGDMTVGALCDLGVKPSAFEWELAKLEIGDFHMHFERQTRQNIEGVQFGIHAGATHTHDQDESEHHEHEHHEHEEEHEHEHEEEHGHAHGETCGHHHGPAQEEEHEHHHHEAEETRSYRDIRALLDGSDLSPFVKKHALGMFARLAVAEAKIHGTKTDDVVFHEVGGLDSIADIVSVCAGIEALGVEKVFVSPLVDGHGFTDTAHGRFPVPAPATLEILKGISVEQIDVPMELITPTGAAIVAEFAEAFGAMPRMKIEKIGYGVGSRVLHNRPNALRAVLGELEVVAGASDPAQSYDTDTITRLETNLDDLSPEITGAVVEKLFSAGALDVFLTPIQMKKNRPGVQLSVLCASADVQKIADLVFTETTSFGLRMDQVQRLKLERKFEQVATPFGEITVKLGLRDGQTIQIAPEFESCRAASDKTRQPLRAIYDAAREAIQRR